MNPTIKIDDIIVNIEIEENEKYIIIEQGDDMIVLDTNQINKISEIINRE